MKELENLEKTMRVWEIFIIVGISIKNIFDAAYLYFELREIRMLIFKWFAIYRKNDNSILN